MDMTMEQLNQTKRDLEWIVTVFDGNPNQKLAAESYSKIQVIRDALKFEEATDIFKEIVTNISEDIKMYIRSFRVEPDNRKAYQHAVKINAEKTEIIINNIISNRRIRDSRQLELNFGKPIKA